MQDQDGKQMMCEALYLFGVQLLLTDRLIPAYSRERILVSYYRYQGQNSIENIKEIFKLCKNTGYEDGKSKPSKYPATFFSRFPINNDIVETMINQLKDDDLYKMLSSFPNPKHRSVALSQ